ncbi:HHL122Cp [Eremothecium sinecaudum]|uniref:peptidyl-tRNA hydrolase n=1 Tax=Eremothecium sinecaudum TaxID=45286 RepID=A0A109V0J6_9SACH|nr:HHL122Cp [Eremothecium sinecaudum]AMD22648.1 HHL122Cp [Eremothecium sinecaudum]
MNINTSNLSFLFTLSALSLAAGYYIGQVCPTATFNNVSPTNAILSEERIKQIKAKALSSEKSSPVDEDYDSECDEDDVEIDSKWLNDIPGEVRMALVIRQDLPMTKGKIAAQCCHSALATYRLMAENPERSSYNPELLSRWLHGGQAKITLKCPDKTVMDELYAKAMAYNVNCYITHDAGRTQITSGTATVLGLGPAPKAVLDEITGSLKLY